MRISDWSSDVCSSDLFAKDRQIDPARFSVARFADVDQFGLDQILPIHIPGRGPVIVEIVDRKRHLCGVADILAQALALCGLRAVLRVAEGRHTNFPCAGSSAAGGSFDSS